MAGFLPSREGVSRRVVALAILCALFPLLGTLGRLHWTLDLFSHFRLQYCAGLLVCGIALAALRRPRSAILCGLGALILAATFVEWFVPSKTHDRQPALKVIAFNVNTANEQREAVADFLLGEAADIVLLQEVDEAWTRSLTPLHELYPYRFGIPREDNFGIVVYSRLPLFEIDLHAFSDYEVPWLSWSVEIDNARYRLAGVHTLPPISAENSALRNAQLAEVRDWVKEEPAASTIVFGDLNATVFSPWLAGFLRESGLRDTAKGFGLWPTWMTAFPPVAIPIDHVLVSRDLVAVNRRLGPSLGSDHRTVVVELAPAVEPQPTRNAARE